MFRKWARLASGTETVARKGPAGHSGCRAERGSERAKDPLDAGGTLPGCWPTREQVNGKAKPVYVITGFDYQEADIDARSISLPTGSAAGSSRTIRGTDNRTARYRLVALRDRRRRTKLGRTLQKEGIV